MKKTKIVCTLGPATTDVITIKKMIQSGMNVARINMSHGNYSEHAERIANIRTAEKELGIHCGILIDLSGPKIRTGDYKTPTIELIPGKKIILTTENIIGDEKRISVSYSKLPDEVRKGSIIMLDDGRRKLIVTQVEGNDIHCKIEIGGTIKPRRGVNILNGNLSIASLTEKDKKDVAWALEQPIDFIALSFVRTAQDVLDLHRILKKKNKYPDIIAKIETAEAIENFEEILKTVQGVMIARGDLSVETPRAKTPVYQKELIRKSIAQGKYSIVATQMMESMIHAPQPTRAEVSDVANAIFDGADAIMTSEETSLGEYPVETVTTMNTIAQEVEDAEQRNFQFFTDTQFPITHAIAHSVQESSERLNASLIVALTETGRTAQAISQFRGTKHILALTPTESIAQKLTIVRGITPKLYTPSEQIAESRSEIKKLAEQGFQLKKNNIIIIASGGNMRQAGATNMMIVEKI